MPRLVLMRGHSCLVCLLLHQKNHTKVKSRLEQKFHGHCGQISIAARALPLCQATNKPDRSLSIQHFTLSSGAGTRCFHISDSIEELAYTTMVPRLLLPLYIRRLEQRQGIHRSSPPSQDNVKTRQDKTRQDKARQGRTRQGETGQGKAGQEARQDKTRDKTRDKAGQGTRQDRTIQDRTRQDRTGQDRTGQDRTGQDKARHEQTRQDRARRRQDDGKTRQ